MNTRATPPESVPAGLRKAHHEHVLPFLRGVRPFQASQLPANAIAGLTLAALAIPEVMGYTRIAGTPVISGLYTILVPMVLFALFGASRHLVVGADSATAAILAAALGSLASPHTEAWTALASELALLVAGLLVVARLLRLGFLADFLSRTVLVGFLTGVGVQVALGELPSLLGLPGGGHGVVGKLVTGAQQFGQLNVADLLVAAGVLAVILVVRRVSRRIPGALIAVIGATAASWGFDLSRRGVRVLGPVPSGLPHFGLPAVGLQWGPIEHLLPSAFAMGVVILAQSAATSRAYAARHGESYSANGDLVGLALANIGAGVTSTFVVNGSPTKTQMVESAGGTSQLAQLIASAVVLLVLLFATRPLAYMPEAVLSAVVFMIGVELIDVQGLRRIHAARPSEFWVALATAVVVVFVGVEQGILAAITLSLIDHVRRGYQPKNTLLAYDDHDRLRPLPVASAAEIRPGLVVYRFSHSMYYANAHWLAEQVASLVARSQPPLKWLCIDMAAVSDVDYSAGETLGSVARSLKAKQIHLVLAEVSAAVRAELGRYQLGDAVPAEAMYATLGEVVKAYEAASGQRAHPRTRVDAGLRQ
jgi:high affinity sulfate transporter 1